jgi:predicted Holliday junction resolvase-like endonuclease
MQAFPSRPRLHRFEQWTVDDSQEKEQGQRQGQVQHDRQVVSGNVTLSSPFVLPL